MKRTDCGGKIEYPKGICASRRRHCRKIISTVADAFEESDFILIAYSGGVDSTVLTHAASQALHISEHKPRIDTAYVNHHLREHEEITNESVHVVKTSSQWLDAAHIIDAPIKEGNIQSKAREARYYHMNKLCYNTYKYNHYDHVALFTAHNMNDVVETKLFQFVTGREVTSIHSKVRTFYGSIQRPLLDFTRKDIKLYAESFGLTWCEDSSNATNKYSRNKIRHELIPWIEKNINPGLIRALG